MWKKWRHLFVVSKHRGEGEVNDTMKTMKVKVPVFEYPVFEYPVAAYQYPWYGYYVYPW
jgi:hypothetical protein